MPISIDKAIKNLKAAKKDAGMVPDDEWEPTIDIAIEALLAIMHQRTWTTDRIVWKLPGETEEELNEPNLGKRNPNPGETLRAKKK